LLGAWGAGKAEQQFLSHGSGLISGLLGLRRLEDCGISALSEDYTGANEFHDETLARAAEGLEATERCDADLGLLVGSEEEAVVDVEDLILGDIVAHNGAEPSSEEHSIASLAVDVCQEGAFTSEQTSAAADELGRNIDIVCSGNERAFRQDPATSRDNAEAHHISREGETESDFASARVGVHAA